ncbi:MAG: hypothetical protein HY347_05210 [candidate division NC10 bacterium]|nr:hypothetical protein [candidate division NC10 bacterium]
MEDVKRWVSGLLGILVEEKSVGESPETWGTLAKSLKAVYTVPLDPLAEPAITLRLETPEEDSRRGGDDGTL